MINDPTKEQMKVVNCKSPLISLPAPGGVGKTDTLGWYVQEQINSRKYGRIIMVTLTNSAADTMNERFEQLGSISDSFNFKAITFHGFARFILPKYADKIGYQKDFKVVPGIGERLLKRIFKENKNRLKSLDKPYEVIRKISEQFLRSNRKITKIAKTYTQDIKICKAIKTIIRNVQKEKQRLNVVDFDDLTFNLYKLVKNYDSVLQSIVKDYPLMIVDEFQDTTNIQWKAMKLFIKNGIHFLGAGDPYQTLYRFAGADHKRFDQLRAISGCKEFKLTKNFRSTMQIVSISNAIRSQLPDYKDSEVWSKDTGPKPQIILSHRKGLLIGAILSKIYDHWKENIPLKEMAVTFRFDEDARQLAKKLIGEKIPFVSYLVLDLLRKEYYQFEDIKYLRGKRYKTDFNKLLKLLREVQKMKNNPLRSLFLIRNFYSSLGKTKEIKDHDPYWTTMLNIVHKSANLQEFLQKYQDSSYGMYCPSNRVADDGEFITLSNIHKIKGKEFKVVFIIGSYDTMFENHEIFGDKEAIKDEIMVMDTAVTRSKRYLYFLFPMTKKEWNERKHKKNPSIFIRNCSEDLYDVYRLI